MAGVLWLLIPLIEAIIVLAHTNFRRKSALRALSSNANSNSPGGVSARDLLRADQSALLPSATDSHLETAAMPVDQTIADFDLARDLLPFPTAGVSSSAVSTLTLLTAAASSAPESRATSESELSAIEFALLASGDDDYRFVEAVVADAILRINTGADVVEDKNTQELIDSIKFHMGNEHVPKSNLPDWRTATQDSLNALFGSALQTFLSKYFLNPAGSSRGLSYLEVGRLAEVQRFELSFKRLKLQTAESLVRRGLLASPAKLKQAKLELQKLSWRPIFGTSIVILTSVLIFTVITMSVTASQGSPSVFVGLVPVVLGVSLIYSLWVGVTVVPGFFYHMWSSFRTLVPGWVPLAWSRSELPRRDLQTLFVRLLVPLAGCVRPAVNLAIGVALFWLVVGCITAPGGVALAVPLLCTLAATVGWILTFKIHDDIRKIGSQIVPTDAGMQILKESEQKFSQSTPLGNLARSLSSDAYNRELCQLVALQGSEVLWMLDRSRLDRQKP